MPKPPVFDLDPEAFRADPYPILSRMRSQCPICFVPQLGATLLTKREDITICEKTVEVFSSHQPKGLMTRLMGENMMRKDGAAHAKERKAAFPAFSPRSVREVWSPRFADAASRLIDALAGKIEADLVADYALPLSGAALVAVTGLEKLTPTEIDWISQSMIDGISNYTNDPGVRRRCDEATAFVDAAIETRLDTLKDHADHSLISVQQQAGLPRDSIKANVKLAISGGQNEPRDAIAGAIWALLSHPDQLEAVRSGDVAWQQVFEEYVRWISPIGMSPRRIARDYTWKDTDFAKDDLVFLMFGSANRDEDQFERAADFDIHRDASRHIAFGAGPHFCAGAAISRMLIADIALPMIFEAFPALSVIEDPVFTGWAFRGPLSLRVRLI